MREVTVVAIFFILLGASSLYFLSQSTLISPIQEDEIEDVGDVSESDVKPDVNEPIVPPQEVPPREPQEVPPREPQEVPPREPEPPQEPRLPLEPVEMQVGPITATCSISQFFPREEHQLIYGLGVDSPLGQIRQGNLTITFRDILSSNLANVTQETSPENITSLTAIAIPSWILIDLESRTIVETPQGPRSVALSPDFLLPRYARTGLLLPFGESHVMVVGDDKFTFNGETLDAWRVAGNLDFEVDIPGANTTIIFEEVEAFYEKDTGVMLIQTSTIIIRGEVQGGQQSEIIVDVITELLETNIDFTLSPELINQTVEISLPEEGDPIALYEHANYDWQVGFAGIVSETSVNLTESRRFSGGDWQLVSWRVVDLGCRVIDDASSKSLSGVYEAFEEALGSIYRFWISQDLEIGSYIRISPVDEDVMPGPEVTLLKVVGDQELSVGDLTRDVWVVESIGDLGGTTIRMYYDKATGFLLRQELDTNGQTTIILNLIESRLLR